MGTVRGCLCFSFVIGLLFAGLTACNKAPEQAADFANGNPADGNLAPVNQAGYQTPLAAPSASAPYEQPVEATEPPPPLPEYSQPPSPGENYMWTPGYWDYSDAGYYWVPGAWVLAPWVGALWTPPWWGYDNGVYLWHAGYWGPHIGFYGGINYGFGYTGRGYYGGYWNHGRLFYNRAVTNVNSATVRDVYNYPVHSGGGRISYNGGRGGIGVRPTVQESAVSRDPRSGALAAQIAHAREASGNREQFAAAGRARPATLAAQSPLSTGYRAPATRPPASAMRAEVRPTTQTRAPLQPNLRPGVETARPETRQSRALPQQFQSPQEAPPRPEARPPVAERAPVAQPQIPRQQPANRPAPEARPSFREARPGPAVARAAPEARPQPRAAAPPPRPARQARPEAQPAPPRPAPQARAEAPRAAPSHPAPEEKRK